MPDIVSCLSVTNPPSLFCLDYPIEKYFCEISKAEEKERALFSMAESTWALADGRETLGEQHSLEDHSLLCCK